MEIAINKDKVSRLLSAFNKFTNITISLFDNKLNLITDAGKWQPYCLAIGKRKDLHRKCENCNIDNAHIALDKRKTHIYTCHAGIVEIIEPIFVNNILIAYIMLGKFRDAEMTYSSKEIMLAAVADYDLDVDVLERAYDELPSLDKSSIDAAITLLKMCVSYIIMEKYIMFEEKISVKIDDYITANIKEKITVDKLCDVFNMSRRALYALFKTEFGCSVKEYVAQKRIDKAKQLLQTTDSSVSEIAEAVGFSDYNYFIRSFKAASGSTPLKFKSTQKHARD